MLSIEPVTTTHRPPVVRELPADLETPVSVYLKLAGTSPSFLLESVTGGERLARFSFIGVDPSRAYILRDGKYESTLPQREPVCRSRMPARIHSRCCGQSWPGEHSHPFPAYPASTADW